MARIIIVFALLAYGALALADASRPGAAEATAGEDWAFKLTPSYYSTSNQTPATDINLRANNGPHAVWLGYYRRSDEFEQARTGYEYTYQVPMIQLVPSLQLATRGFAGGSLNLQAGGPVFALLGFGRTNGRDYYNLNFDPNDSAVYGFGAHPADRHTVSLYTVRDNRLHTEQVVTHVVWRFEQDERQRWTFDLSTKHGRPSPEEDSVSGQAFTLTYDYHPVFIRVARDRKVNFSNDDQNRLSLGLRF